MRKIEREVIGAFIQGKDLTVGNTKSSGGALYLHDNRIAEIADDGRLSISNAGWDTRTTQSRLNALCSLLRIDHRVWTKNFVMRVQTMTQKDIAMGEGWHVICEFEDKESFFEYGKGRIEESLEYSS